MTTPPPYPPDRPYSPPPGGAQPWGPPPTTRKRRVWPWVLVGLAVALIACVLGVGGLLAGNGSDPATPSNGEQPTVAQEDATAPPSAKVGKTARDGKFEFTVTKVKCGVAKVGGDYGVAAQGQFCLVTVKVANIGKESQFLSDSEQKAFDAKGTQYSTDSEAGVYVESNDVLFNEINPGNSVTGVLVFDIPKGVKLARIELHDSAFSGGVTVQL